MSSSTNQDTPMEDREDPDSPSGSPSKRPKLDSELLRREKSLGEFVLEMDKYAPLIPDAVTDYYLSRSGFQCDDVRIKRLLALAAQKFVADIATDALQYSRVKTQNPANKGGGKGKDKKLVLTMEDVTAALQDRGVNIAKPDFFK